MLRQLIVFLCAPTAFFLPSFGSSQTIGIAKEEINVHIALPKKEFHVGESIEIKLEVTNAAKEPLLVPNEASIFDRASEAYLEIELSHAGGRVYPHMGWAVDRFPNDWLPQKSAMEKVMESFLLLRPATSVVQRIPLSVYLGVSKYEVKPGIYKLKCYYSSGGLFYPPAYQRLGLTEEDVKSIPFQAWHGKVNTNELSFTILRGGENR
jgi:hypothetical protein